MSTSFRSIDGSELHRVGDDGSVWTRLVKGSSLLRVGDWRMIAPYPNGGSGHLFVRLNIGDRRRKRYVHRLVLEAFAGPCPSGLECLHRDGDPTNNALANLRWGTRAENCTDTAAHGRAHRGDRHVRAKLREADIPVIREIRREIHGATFVDLGILFGVSESTIRAAVRGRNWSWMKGASV